MKYHSNMKPNVVLLLLIACAFFRIIVLIFFLCCMKWLRSFVRIFKPMSKLLLGMNRPSEPSPSHECMTRFVKSFQSKVLP